jgi:hypothetical protein
MDIYRAGTTPLRSVAIEYLLAQAEYTPSESRVAEVVDLIEKANPAKVWHGEARGCFVLHVPDDAVPILVAMPRLQVMGLASQYGIGKLRNVTLDGHVYTHHYESGDILVAAGAVLEVRSRTHFVPGDVVREARGAGRFRGRTATDGREFYHFANGLVEVRDPDRSPDIPAEVRKNPDWSGRTLMVTIGDTTKRVFVTRYQPGCRGK